MDKFLEHVFLMLRVFFYEDPTIEWKTPRLINSERTETKEIWRFDIFLGKYLKKKIPFP